MRTLHVATIVVTLGPLACNAIPGAGINAEVCETYFKEAEACAAKNGGLKADMIRKMVSESKKGFEKNLNPVAVSKSCEVMLDTLRKDPACAADKDK